MNILGITAPLSWNTAACLVVNDNLEFFAEEERYDKIKHSPKNIPKKAILNCLRFKNLSIKDIDAITIGFNSPTKISYQNFFQQLKEGNYSEILFNQFSFLEYKKKINELKNFLKELGLNHNEIKDKIFYYSHHECHVASSIFCNDFEESLFLSLDGMGEKESGSYGCYRNGKIETLGYIDINQSLGWLYSVVTDICGFKSHSHEGKVMGLAPFGKNRPELLDGVCSINNDGYKLHKNWKVKLYENVSPRSKNLDNNYVDQIYKDLARTTQVFLEKSSLTLINKLYQKYKIRNISLSGGVALNCDMNYHIAKLSWVKNIFIQPAANDAGTAMGSAFLHRKKFQNKHINFMKKNSVYTGNEYTDKEVTSLLEKTKIDYRRVSLNEVAMLLKEGHIIGWFNGRMEFGPRALGGRSILAHPGIEGIQDKINSRVKNRELWRPFAPSILHEKTNEYSEINSQDADFMLITYPVNENIKSKISQTVHVDNTARFQSVKKEYNKNYYDLINEFYKITGIPVLLNTSFNDDGRPICLDPKDALQVFFSSGLDYLYLEGYLISKDRTSQK